MRDINEYLKPWGSIRSNRSGMLSSSMARALAPYDEASEDNYREALELLNQNPRRLHCVYCFADAAEWDHLISVMRGGVPTGFGHQFGNLVPACSPCNKQKLASDWIEFLRTKAGNNFEDRREVIERYRKRFKPEPLPHPESTWNQLQEIRGEILKLFEKADAIVRSAK